MPQRRIARISQQYQLYSDGKEDINRSGKQPKE